MLKTILLCFIVHHAMFLVQVQSFLCFQQRQISAKQYLSKKDAIPTVEFIPANIRLEAIEGKNIIDFAKLAGVEITWSCRKGECKKCEVTVDGKNVLACRTKLPAFKDFPNSNKLQILVPKPPTKK